MKSNVCYNLNKSNYYTQYSSYKFYFSSQFNKNRFDKQVQDFVTNENCKLKSRYNCEINAEIMLAISLYRKLEKRGFYILNGCNLPLSKNYTIEMVVYD